MPFLPAVRTAVPSVIHAVQRAGCSTEACVSNWKITFSILLVVESLIFGHIVLLVRAFSCISPQSLLAMMRYGSAVAGGIFLSTGLLHIVPESLHLYEVVQEQRKNVSNSHGSHAGHGHGGHSDHGHGGHSDHASHGGELPFHGHSLEFPVVFSIILASFYMMLIVEHVLISMCQRKSLDFEDDDEVSFDPDRSESLDPELFGRTSINLANAIGARDDRNDEDEEGNGYRSRSFLACLVITAGVAAHSILESVALGASETFKDVLNLFIAIAAHRWATAAALGIRYARAGLAAGPVVVLVFVFSFIAPIGVGFGFLAVGSDQRLTQAVLFSMAAGTFVFLGASATLEEGQLRMYLASAIGAVIIVIITAILIAKNVH